MECSEKRKCRFCDLDHIKSAVDFLWVFKTPKKSPHFTPRRINEIIVLLH